MARDCELCGAPKAVGKYFTEPQEGCVSGWWRVCADDAAMVESQGYDVTYYKSHKRKQALGLVLSSEQQNCAHNWLKHSLVTTEGGFDWMRCQECGCFGRRYGLGQDGVTRLQPNSPVSFK